MKSISNLILFGFVLSLFFSCTQKNSDENEHGESSELLLQAYAVHQELLDLREEIMRIEKELDKSLDYTNLKADLRIWDKDIIEVPGFEHSHDDEHQRSYHVHNPMKKQSDEQHLQYQQMMLEEIKVIYQRFTELTITTNQE
jgi:hypothetical protein